MKKLLFLLIVFIFSCGGSGEETEFEMSYVSMNNYWYSWTSWDCWHS